MKNEVLIRFYLSNAVLFAGVLMIGYFCTRYILLNKGEFAPTISYSIRRNMKYVKLGTVLVYGVFAFFTANLFFVPFIQDVPYAIQAKGEQTTGCVIEYFHGSKWEFDSVEVRTRNGVEKFKVGNEKNNLHKEATINIEYFPHTRIAEIKVVSEQCRI